MFRGLALVNGVETAIQADAVVVPVPVTEREGPEVFMINSNVSINGVP